MYGSNLLLNTHHYKSNTIQINRARVAGTQAKVDGNISNYCKKISILKVLSFLSTL